MRYANRSVRESERAYAQASMEPSSSTARIVGTASSALSRRPVRCEPWSITVW
ncbi:hypothetical protein [Streptomyces sp. NPDC101455]|uniref:hypothetical protein n=1 Tax=Streptomyces sp. NPDC101455 TaxID=3366142 RepID=UPI00382256C3